MSPMPLTKGGYDFYEVASLLQKSLRRGDSTLASRAANELFPQYTNYIWNRMLTVSAEDCHGLITHEIVALFDAWTQVNVGKTPKGSKGRVFIAKAIVLLSQVKHSRDADSLNVLISDRLPEPEFRAAVEASEALIDVPPKHFTIPSYTYDKHTRRGAKMGKTVMDFLIEEEAGLSNRTTMYANIDQMIAAYGTDRWVEPEFGEQGELF